MTELSHEGIQSRTVASCKDVFSLHPSCLNQKCALLPFCVFLFRDPPECFAIAAHETRRFSTRT